MRYKARRIFALILSVVISVSFFPGMAALAAEVISRVDVGERGGIPAAAAPLAVTQEGGTFYVRSAEDFFELAKKCTIDSYSDGIRVILSENIDLSEAPNTVIPIFSGTFEGGGHKITGLNISDSASHTGLFRYLTEEGSIKNLKVEGTVKPGGTGKNIGGIVGNNFGTIVDCHFTGSVEGISSIGGISGTNEKTGTIDGCRSFASVGGERLVGGIVGQNLGVVRRCTNSGDVNTVYRVATTAPLTDFDFHNIDLGSLSVEAQITSIGGISGYNTGVISSSTNTGAVGYDNTGYNVGGIAGRQSGYIYNCSNSGAIKGSSDIGGIVGQMEPHLELDLTAGSAENLIKQMNILHDLLNKTLNDSEGATNALSTRLGAMSTHLGGAMSDMEYLSEQTVNFVDETMNSVNEISSRIDYAFDRMPQVLQSIENATKSLSVGFEYLQKVNEDLDIVSKMETSTYDETDYYLLTMTDGTGGSISPSNYNPAAGQKVTITVTPENGYAMQSISATDADGNSLSLTQEGANSYSFIMPTQSGDPINDPVNAVAKNTVVRASFAPLPDYAALTGHTVILSSDEGGRLSANKYNPAAGETVTIKVEINEGYGMKTLSITDANGSSVEYQKQNNSGTEYSFTMPTGGEALVTAHFERLDNWTVVEGIKADMDLRRQRLSINMAAAKANVNDILTLLGFTYDPATNTWTPPSSFNLNSSEEDELIRLLTELAQNGLKVTEDLAGIIADMDALLKIIGPFVSEAARQANADLEVALGHMQDASNSMTDAISVTKGVFQYLNGLPDVKFPTLGSEYTLRMDSLFKNLNAAAGSLNGMSAAIASTGSLIVSDLRAVNDQLNLVLLLMVDAMNNMMNRSLSSRCTDIPEEDVNSTEGKVRACKNSGSVQGESNIGGLAGNMGIDSQLESEVSLMGTGALAPHFLSKCYMRDCANSGIISAREDCVGSLVGRQSLGSIADSRGFGAARSEAGSYVGGIVGNSLGTVTDCWSMCALSGGSRIGGIAGFGTFVSGSNSLVSVETGTEFIGAIVGEKNEDNGEIKMNSFVSDSLQGIDGISYRGIAEPIPFEQLRSMTGLPGEFLNLSITFIAEGRKVATLEFPYGGSINKEDIPTVPRKPGYTGLWPEFPTTDLRFSSTIEAEYIGQNTTLASEEKRPDSDLSIVLVEGDFRPEASVDVTRIDAEALPDAVELALPVLTGVSIKEALIVKIKGGIKANDAQRLRYLPPALESRLSELVIYIKTADGWSETQYERSGKYVLIEANGEEITLATASRVGNPTKYIMAGAGIAGIAVLSAAAVALSRRGKKRGAHQE